MADKQSLSRAALILNLISVLEPASLNHRQSGKLGLCPRASLFEKQNLNSDLTEYLFYTAKLPRY
jgi:hypothetical protein